MGIREPVRFSGVFAGNTSVVSETFYFISIFNGTNMDSNIPVLLLFWFVSLTLATFLSVRIIKKYPQYGFPALVSFYVVYLTSAQVIAARTVDYGTVGTLALIAPGGTLIYPFISQVLDMINEVYGRKKAMGAIGIAFVTQVLYVAFIGMSMVMEPSPYFEYEIAWQSLFSLSAGIVIASWISFVVCSVLDAYMFSYIKRKLRPRELAFKGDALFNPYIWLRSLSTDAVSLAVDSVIFAGIAFGFFGGMPADQLITLIVGQMLIKTFIGVIDTPWFVLYKRMLSAEIRENNPDDGI